MKVGRHTYGHEAITVHSWGEKAQLEIGSFCSIADRCHIFLGGNHRTDWVTTFPFPAFPNEWQNAANIQGHPRTNGDVKIGSDVWIGSGVTIMSGVTIHHGAVIGAGSVVVKDIEAYSIVGGNPAKTIRFRFEEDIIKRLLEIAWWEWSDREINKLAPELCSPNVKDFVAHHSRRGLLHRMATKIGNKN